MGWRCIWSLKSGETWILNEYFKAEPGSTLEEDGWFETGDVATIDPNGFMAVDRTKMSLNLVENGSVQLILKTLRQRSPKGCWAAVIGVYHPQWTERPLLLFYKQRGRVFLKKKILSWFDGKVAKWWIPDDVVDSLPHTATGKIQSLSYAKSSKIINCKYRGLENLNIIKSVDEMSEKKKKS